MKAVKKKNLVSRRPPSDGLTYESKTILWRGYCRDALQRICVSDAIILRNVQLKIVSRLAMQDARRHYQAEKLGAGQVMGWPDCLYRGTASPQELPEVLKKFREEYHASLITPELQEEVNRLWELHIHWRDELAKRAADAGLSLSGLELVNWVCGQSALLYELAQAGIVPTPPART